MEHGEFLFTVAEVAVAFAGFASIVGILGQRAASSPARINALRIRIMLLHSLAVVAFSLIPYLVHSYGIHGEAVWRASSALFLIVSAIVGVSFGLWVRAVRLDSVYDRPGFVALGVLFVETVLSLANVLGLTEGVAAAIYLTALVSRLFLSGLAFSVVMFSFLSSSESGG